MRKAPMVAAAILLGAGLTIGGPVKAQIDNGLPGPQPFDAGSYILNDTMNKIRMDNNAAHRGTQKHAAPHHKTPAARSANTIYQSSPVVSARVRKQYLDWVRKTSPTEADQLKTVFAQHNPVQIWQGIVRDDGLRTGDASDALAAYWILNYLIATQGKDSTRAQALAVRNQIKPMMAANPAFARLTQAQKQEVAETWMVNFVVQQGVYGTALKKGDSQLLQKLADAATARFQNEMHIDLRQLTLTNNGFVPKGG